jgi:AP-3 complex subunit delta-1
VVDVVWVGSGGMVSKKNLQDIVLKLMTHLETADGTSYRDSVIAKIIDICSNENYKYVTDFGWYLEVLIKLTYVEDTKHGKMIGGQLMDVSIRVKVVRKVATQQLVKLLGEDSHLLVQGNQKNGVCEVMYAAAYVSGEFAANIDDPAAVALTLLGPGTTLLPPHIQAVFVHNAVKIYGFVGNTTKPEDEEGQVAGADSSHAVLSCLALG